MKNRHLMERVLEAVDLSTEPVPGKTLIEIVDNRSILIENHCGVISYGKERIIIKTKNGCIIVSGTCLILSKMSKDILRITGVVTCVELQGRG